MSASHEGLLLSGCHHHGGHLNLSLSFVLCSNDGYQVHSPHPIDTNKIAPAVTQGWHRQVLQLIVPKHFGLQLKKVSLVCIAGTVIAARPASDFV